MPRKIYSKYDNLWSDARKAAGMRNEDIADIFKVNQATVANWFSGHSMPAEDKIKNLCELFGIEFDAGYEAFADANVLWCLTHNRPVASRFSDRVERVASDANLAVPITENTPKHRRKSSDCQVSAQVEPSDMNLSQFSTPVPNTAFEKLAPYLYGKVTYEEYEGLRENISGVGDPMELLYGKVSFDEYMKILELTKDA